MPVSTWSEQPKENELDALSAVHMVLVQVLSSGVTGIGVVETFFRHRIQPLKARVHSMYEYVGQDDPTRESRTELVDSKVRARVWLVVANLGILWAGSGLGWDLTSPNSKSQARARPGPAQNT